MHMAAETVVGYSITDPQRYFNVNGTGGLTLLEAMRQHGVERIVVLIRLTPPRTKGAWMTSRRFRSRSDGLNGGASTPVCGPRNDSTSGLLPAVACPWRAPEAGGANRISRRIVFSSSAAAYGEPLSSPIEGDHPKAPLNAYGESKLIFERILHWHGRAYGLKHVFLRYFNAAGATDSIGKDHDPETHLIPNVLKAALGARLSRSSGWVTQPPTEAACGISCTREIPPTLTHWRWRG